MADADIDAISRRDVPAGDHDVVSAHCRGGLRRGSARTMSLNTIRRGQLIAPFGPGALIVLRNGVSVINAGLDHWFCTNDDFEGADTDREEYKLREWRLERELKVDYFMLPPDHRFPPRHSTTRIR